MEPAIAEWFLPRGRGWGQTSTFMDYEVGGVDKEVVAMHAEGVDQEEAEEYQPCQDGCARDGTPVFAGARPFHD
ncbi:MAG TPA: hypothetical protein VN946_23645 [Terriglobales bacterium]|nr:hypothetical protein [Terriglobales bacterium]